MGIGVFIIKDTAHIATAQANAQQKAVLTGLKIHIRQIRLIRNRAIMRHQGKEFNYEKDSSI